MEIPERYKTILAILGFVAIAACVLLLPLYFAFQPSFCRSCHTMQAHYESWRKSTHANQGCIDCHTEPGGLNKILFALNTYSPIYAFHESKPGSVEKPEDATCLRCHTADRIISGSGIVMIPHKLHVVNQKIKCVDCHEYLVHYPNPKGRNTPSMENCLKSCHKEKAEIDACTICHPKKATPKSHSEPDWKSTHPERFKQDNYICTGCHTDCNRCHTIRPENHTVKWKYSEHGQQAEVISSKVCGTCHDNDFCGTCHLTHPLDWKDIHYSTVLRKTYKSCTTCHEPNEFCIKCHSYIKQ